MQPAAAHPQTADGAVPLGNRSEVFPDKPMADYDAAGGTAHLARMRGAHTADLMAIICRSGYPPRSDIVNQLRRIDNPAILRLLDQGMVDLPQEGQRYYGFVFEQPQNPRLWTTLDETRPPLGEDFLNRRVITPLTDGLKQFADVGLMHGSVRPTNMFWRENSGGAPQLGECVSVAPGIGQPLMFESLERAQALPYARGAGTILDDMYALGVTIIMLALGRNPLKGLDDATILRLRLERGSFTTMLDNHKLPPGHVELLRGLLQDDPQQRWTPYDVEQWLSGQRLSPKQSEFNKRATRGLSFAGKEYWQVRPLLPMLWSHSAEAAKLLQTGEIDRWLRRSMSDPERADRLDAALEKLKNSGRSTQYEEQMVTLASIALDPQGPIAYRGQIVMPGGVGGALAEAMRTGEHLQLVAEIISNQFVGAWVQQQTHGKAELMPLEQSFERMRGHVEQSGFGSGLERVVYELNPTLGCLSPLVRGHNVIAAPDFLIALEKTAAQGNRPREPIDRHIAGWLVVKDRQVEQTLRGLNSGDDALRRGLATLALYNYWQEKHGPDALPGLCSWLAGILEPMVRRYYNRPTRDAAAAALQQAVASGELRQLVRLLDDPSLVARDQQGFQAARQIYRATVAQIAVLERQRQQQKEVERIYGRPTATYIAWVLSAMMALYTIIRAMTGS
jgi:eukaryotic-like serine/threonine-protein kinase